MTAGQAGSTSLGSSPTRHLSKDFAVNGSAEFYGLSDAASGQIVFWGLLAIGAMLGAATYCVCVRGRRLPRRAALVTAVVPVLLLGGYAYHNTWARFRGVAVDAEAVELVYGFPRSSVVVPRADVARVTQAPEPGHGDSWQLVIVTTTGSRYESWSVQPGQCAALHGRLRAWSE